MAGWLHLVPAASFNIPRTDLCTGSRSWLAVQNIAISMSGTRRGGSMIRIAAMTAKRSASWRWNQRDAFEDAVSLGWMCMHRDGARRPGRRRLLQVDDADRELPGGLAWSASG